MNAAHLRVVEEIEVFPDPFPTVIAMRTQNAESDLASTEHDARERARRDLIGLANERKEQRLAAARTETERREATRKHCAELEALEERFMRRQREVRDDLLADVKSTLYPAALLVAVDETRRSAGVGRVWRELSERSTRELGVTLGPHNFALAFFAAHGEALRRRYPDGGETIERRAAEEAARIGDPLWFQKDQRSFEWSSYNGYSHRITPQAFIADAIEHLAGADASTESWRVAEVLACVSEFIKRSKREDFPEGYAVSRVGSTGAQDLVAEQHAARERKANAKHRERRARAFEKSLTDDELHVALAAVDRKFHEQGE